MYIEELINEKKVFIIENADNMTPQAQNALLKTLEEPPEYVIIILIAQNAENFLPTVLSRCVIMNFRPLNNVLVKSYLVEKLGATQEKADFLAEYSSGSIGEAIKLLEDNDFYLMREDVINVLDSIDYSNTVQLMFKAAELEKYKNYPELLDIIYMWYRDVIFYKFFNASERVIQKDKIDIIKNQAERLSFETIEGRLNHVAYTKKLLKQNTAFQLSMEVLFINMKES